ncbi:Fic/DOC family protein [Isobaculum melis]|uniref:Fic/DOC family protein n=1 Tax=Isobaculum melis TaxID=142588 RepID=A0A1H9Q164_9LACT|nr:Fic/DOC family protein [Isobaculum melis]
MSIPQEYLEDVLIRLAYHSSAIEGNTISLAETVSIILENVISTNEKGYSIREFYEVENHKHTFSYLIEQIENKQKLTVEMIKEFHALLLDRIEYDKGQYITIHNAILGSTFQTATPQDTPFLMLQWVDNTTFRMNVASIIDEAAEVLAESHIQFERIHPFSDGNGRTGRLINIFLSFSYGYAPAIVQEE